MPFDADLSYYCGSILAELALEEVRLLRRDLMELGWNIYPESIWFK